MIHGPDLSELQSRAKNVVMLSFVNAAERDGTPPTLRALYVMKAQQAELVLAGGTSEMISAEAELRGVTPEQMATVISDMAKTSQDAEIHRMAINVSIEKATSGSEVIKIIESIGLKL